MTEDRVTDKKERGRVQAYKVAAATQIFKGSAVCVNAAGFAVQAINSAGFLVVGVAEHNVDNLTGANGDKSVNCAKGVYAFIAEAADEPTQALVGHGVYAASGNEVELTAGANAVFMGTLEEIDKNGVDFWVRMFDQSVT